MNNVIHLFPGLGLSKRSQFLFINVACCRKPRKKWITHKRLLVYSPFTIDQGMHTPIDSRGTLARAIPASTVTSMRL